MTWRLDKFLPPGLPGYNPYSKKYSASLRKRLDNDFYLIFFNTDIFELWSVKAKVKIATLKAPFVSGNTIKTDEIWITLNIIQTLTLASFQ